MLPKYKLEVFKESELVVNITQHAVRCVHCGVHGVLCNVQPNLRTQLVPQFKVMDDDQKKTLLERYNITEEQLPRMQETDPIARYFGLSRRQVNAML